MASLVPVLIHPSQFPEQVQQDLLRSLRLHQIKHKFHYDSYRQTQKWLALHRAYSPARTNPDYEAVYDSSFAAAAGRITSPRATVIGLGCGGGQKDTRLLRLLAQHGKPALYLPCDVSTAMVLVAQETASPVAAGCRPIVFDLELTDDLPAILSDVAPRDSNRIITFFGMLPNFEPRTVMSRLAAVLVPGDSLLLSANLAPGADYEAGMRTILPQYHNAMTRDWLNTFLSDLGSEPTDGEIRFDIEDCPQSTGAKRVTAHYQFRTRRILETGGERFEFQAGDTLRLFFSYRYTPCLVEDVLSQYQIAVLDHWITRSEEEGVFLCSKIA